MTAAPVGMYLGRGLPFCVALGTQALKPIIRASRIGKMSESACDCSPAVDISLSHDSVQA